MLEKLSCRASDHTISKLPSLFWHSVRKPFGPSHFHLAMLLVNLPREVIEVIIHECAKVDLASVAALAKTCGVLRDLIGLAADHHLWRNIFLDIFDDPRPAISYQTGQPLDTIQYDWKIASQRRFRASRRIMNAMDAELEEFGSIVDDDAVDAIMQVAQTSTPGVSQPSLNGPWLEEVFQSAIFPDPTTQLTAKLNVLASFLSVSTSVSLPRQSSVSALSRLASRAFVYDMRNHNEDTRWGPWLEDGVSIDWRMVWHLINVIRHNSHERNNLEFPIMEVKHLRAGSMPEPLNPKERPWNDWAGVEGTWTRCISFMDYHDLHAYNVSQISLWFLLAFHTKAIPKTVQQSGTEWRT